jgi:TRIAD3 protein (E3 ubiquitin-protein ligase RNF216)
MEFSETPMVFIDTCLAQSGYRLFSAYRVLEEAHRTFDPKRPAYNKIKTARKVPLMYLQDSMELLIASSGQNMQEIEILREMDAARRIRRKADAKRQAERLLELEEEENVRKAEADGTMSECGCCFGDFPLNRMVHCDNEEVMHWFCRGCARTSAETEIGNSRYHLKCMSMDTCEAGFSLEQR